MATNDELLRQWAEQNGADYNLLVGAQNGNTGTSTSTGNTGNTGSTGNSNTNNDIYSEYGWDSNNLPGTSIPTSSTTATPTTTTTTGTSTTSGGTSVQDYINYYTSRGMTTPDMDYNTWVNWMQGGGSSTTPTTGGGTTTGGTTGGTTTGGTTTPTTGGTTGTTTGGTAPTTGGTTATQGTSVQDYIDYYTSRGMTTPDMSYEQWVTWMQNGGTTTPTGGNTGGTTGGQTGGTTGGTTTGGTTAGGTTGTTGNQTQGTSVQDYINYWVSRGVTTPPMDYNTWVTFITNGGGTTNPGGGTTGGTTGGNLPGGNATHNYPTVDMDNRQRISDMYDAQIEAQRAALQEQGDQALSDAQANRDKIASLYNKQRNAASVDWERQRRNFLEGAATSGINTGAGSQAELSMNSMYQRAQNDLGAAQAQAEADADRNIADIKRSTQASINEAIAKNDYQKAAALLDEYNEQYNRAVDRAEALAEFGDFSGYAALYGDDAAAQMRYTWVMSNPEIALATGQITQQQYAALTVYKQYPALALTGGTAGSGSSDPWAYGGSGWNGSGTSTDTPQTTDGNTNSAPTYSGMTPETYAAYINSLVASGQLTGAEGQQLIREAYGQTG